MKLVIFEDDRVENFYPLTLSRAVFELRCGIDSLGEKIARWAGRTADAVVVREYLSATLQARTAAKVNDLAGLDGGPVLFVNGRVLVPGDAPAPAEPGAYYGP
ncbi:MAG: putative sugar nucleotidyl transferase, partial [Phycisphaerae bacterium]